ATIYQGQAAAGTGQFLAEGWQKIPTPPYDPVKAKQLLAAAGYSNLSIPIKYHLQTPDMKPMSEAVAQYWTAIGVKVTLVPSEYSTLRTVVGEGNSSGWCFPFSMPGYYFDQYERLMTLQLDPDKLGGYYTAIDPSLYTLVRQLYGNLNIANRTAVAKSVLKAMADGYWIVPIAVPDTNWAIGKRVSSWSPVKTLYAASWETLTRAP
ncbi:MAG: ABC transporter substrate-binding protein, partial [Dehalococcoidia bacterium]|nr:ABC transporter substrate-binding protein [Dehalococcoidia bacterium]